MGISIATNHNSNSYTITPEDLTTVIETHGQAITKYCNSILCDYHEAQDAAQTTFIKAYTKRHQYRPDKGILPWLYKIAFNTCMDTLRKKKFLFLFDTKTPEASYEMPDTTMSEELRAALKTLSPKDRALVFNRVIDKLDYKELTTIYNATEAALHKRYQRAKKKLAKAILEQREGQ
ncbi:MAG: sigma-70 family RNA polymerase sigma factor [Defluviitaleaceae bacterium]|nr:sigma-70 family RNA polymerase sigma factor [Defluviitaleaceae bacterium]